SQPEITDCTNSGELERTCVVPAMTAGRYVIVAQDGATSTAAGATMTMVILLNGSPCVALKSQPFTGKKGLPAGCQVSVLTDEPMRVTARFAVEHATADAGGPHMVIQRAPWNGLLDVRGGQVAMRQPAAPAAAAK
ncbi:MAG: hypothetical protein ACRDQZ_02885, partial [Mycobacteriales bacterium]